jgi:allophanate hydrolase subunit 1
VDDLDAVLALHARLAATRPPGVVDLVPAARTVLVVVDPTMLSLASARTWVLSARTGVAHVATPGRTVEIPVVYDGEDLHPLAAELGISVAQLTARHAAADWTVAFTGFAPGSAISSARTGPTTCRGGRARGRACRPAPSRSPDASRVRTRGRRPAAGS